MNWHKMVHSKETLPLPGVRAPRLRLTKRRGKYNFKEHIPNSADRSKKTYVIKGVRP